jgi:hypothetical protein
VITKVQGLAHERAVAEISAQLRVITGAILATGGGNMDLQFPATRRRIIRRPDDRNFHQLETIPLLRG